jgi:hypothetical protein
MPPHHAITVALISLVKGPFLAFSERRFGGDHRKKFRQLERNFTEAEKPLGLGKKDILQLRSLIRHTGIGCGKD